MLPWSGCLLRAIENPETSHKGRALPIYYISMTPVTSLMLQDEFWSMPISKGRNLVTVTVSLLTLVSFGCLQHCHLTAPPTSIWVPDLPFCTPFVSGPLTPLGMQRLSCTVGLVGTVLAHTGSLPQLYSGIWVLTFGSPTLHVSSKLLALAGE